MRSFKLFVQPTDNCVNLLKFVLKRVKAINRMGVRIIPVPIAVDEHGTHDLLKQKGITRLPAMLLPSGTCLCGGGEIEKEIQKNIDKLMANDKVSLGGGNEEILRLHDIDPSALDGMDDVAGGGDPLRDYMENVVGTADTEYEDDNEVGERIGDYNSRMRDFEKRRERRTPGRMRANVNNDNRRRRHNDDDEDEPRRDRDRDRGDAYDNDNRGRNRAGNGGRNPPDTGYNEYADETNIDTSQLRMSGEQSDHLDDMMMNAWTANNPT